MTSRLMLIFNPAGIIWATCLLVVVSAIADEPTHWRTGESLRRELDEVVSANWTRQATREMISEVAIPRRIAVVFDRRLDPSIEFPVNLSNVALSEGFSQLASLVQGQISLSDQFVYFGPKPAAEKLRTLMELRRLELMSKDTGVSSHRRKELQRRALVQWSDLESPREILKRIAETSQFKIANPDLIPHDLWAAASLPEVTPSDALTVVLIQFDLTFRWTDAAETIELVPIPDAVSIERKHRSRQKPADAIERIRETYPAIDAKIVQGQIVVDGRLEDHEAIENLLIGRAPAQPGNDRGKIQALRQRKFTFKSPSLPASVIMKKIEESDIRFEYDRNQLQSAGIDLEQEVQIDVKEVTADEFFKSLFDPLGVQFQIDRTVVKLLPKRAKS